MSDKKTPLGISILSILLYISAAIDIVVGVIIFLARNDAAMKPLLPHAIGLIVLGIILALLAMGLRNASKGVRMIIGIIEVIHIVVGLLLLIAAPGMRIQGILIIIAAAAILYLLYGREDAKEFFA